MSSSLSILPVRVRWGRRSAVGDTGNGGRDTGCGVSESPSAFSTHPGDFTGTPRAPERAGLALTGKSGVGCAKWLGIVGPCDGKLTQADRSEEHTSELQSLMRLPYAVYCLNKKTN